ncbi:hypothetical protein GCM10010185_70600 [Saccharothrix coeruleofusca]|uniref:Uncharacterized protein n=1 Tax=Saccharothrix coeruleofusca TaxID=33919 RepID=A0A918EIK0_9PSEU|nr:hypothetical protein GCM10010185_70600 [Saccharothrix coeruleofusca]
MPLLTAATRSGWAWARIDAWRGRTPLERAWGRVPEPDGGRSVTTSEFTERGVAADLTAPAAEQVGPLPS